MLDARLKSCFFIADCYALTFKEAQDASVETTLHAPTTFGAAGTTKGHPFEADISGLCRT